MSHDVHAHRDVLEAAGPAFIKWGQWAATRHDLFPPDFCAILEHLHTQVSAYTQILGHHDPDCHYTPLSSVSFARHDLFPLDFCAILEHLHTQISA